MPDCSTQGCTNFAPSCKSGNPPLCSGCWGDKQLELAIEASKETAQLEATAQQGPECVPVQAATPAATPAATSAATPAPDLDPGSDPVMDLLLMENKMIKGELHGLAQAFREMKRIHDATQHQLAELMDLLQYSGGPDDLISRMRNEIDDLKRRVTEAESWA